MCAATYVPLHLYEPIFDLQELSSGLVTLLLPLPDVLRVLPSSRGRAVHHALLLFPLTKSLVVLLHLMEVEKVRFRLTESQAFSHLTLWIHY